MAFAPVFRRPFSATFDRRAAAVPWWLAGGAPTPVAVYQPIRSASLAASYVNLANPGTYDAAPGTAPTFNAATGWTFNGTTQYLRTGIIASDLTYSIVLRFSGRSVSGDRVECGAITFHPNRRTLEIAANISGLRIYGNGNNSREVSPGVESGVMGMAGMACYLNGISDGTIAAFEAASLHALYLGCLNIEGSPSYHSNASLQACAIWNTSTNHATWMPAVSAAVALI